jgi:addiction module RelE/StbE family toxin
VKLHWASGANADLVEIFDHLIRENPNTASDVLDRIEEAALPLLDHPRLGRPGRVAGTRELVVGEFPYVLPYCIQQDTIVVLRVLHSARKWPAVF